VDAPLPDLAGRTAVVTGGGHGIGRGIALALGREGMRVAVLDIESDAAEDVAAELRAQGAESFALDCDVTQSESLSRAASRIEARFGPVHVLSNNAGVSLPQGPLEEKTEADWQWAFSINLFGIVKSVQAFLPGMKAHGQGGQIVNTSSMAGLIAIPDLEVGVYTASKYACNGYSEILRAELAPFGIGVSVLCPGLIDTELARTSARNRPEAYGGPLPEPDAMPEGMRAAAMAPEEVGPIVVRGIRANRAHVLTHPDLALPLVAARFEAIRADAEAERAERD